MAVSRYAFWRDVGERGGMTFAQSFLAIVVASRVGDGSASAVD